MGISGSAVDMPLARNDGGGAGNAPGPVTPRPEPTNGASPGAGAGVPGKAVGGPAGAVGAPLGALTEFWLTNPLPLLPVKFPTAISNLFIFGFCAPMNFPPVSSTRPFRLGMVYSLLSNGDVYLTSPISIT